MRSAPEAAITSGRGAKSPPTQFITITQVMPKITKKDLISHVHKLLAKAAYLLQEENQFEYGFIALQDARAIIADLDGDIESARVARLSAENLRILIRSSKSTPISEVVSAYPDQR